MTKLGLALVVALSLVACKSSNGDFCDAEHPCSDPARPYCDIDGTYPASEGVAKTCIPDPDGGGACDGDEDCTDPSLPACEAQVCHECHDATQCTASAPVCDSGFSCAGCTAPADCAAYTATPICGASGACVECDDNTDCSGTTPICNAAGSCEACTAHDQCDSGICDTGTGACVAEGMIAYVSTTGSGTACTKATPCLTVQAGVDAARPYVLVADGTYDETITVDGTQVVAIIGPATLTTTTTNSIVSVSETASATIEGLTVRSGAGRGLRCLSDSTGARLVVSNSVVSDNDGVGIEVTNCSVDIVRSTISHNDGGGLRVTSSTSTITNSFVVRNGDAGSVFGGILIGEPRDDASTILFSTVSNNVSGDDELAKGVACNLVGRPVAMRGVLVWGSGLQVTTDVDCHFENSNLSGVAAAGTNISEMPTYVNAPEDNFHLAPGSAGIDMGGTTGVPAVDFDGEARPQGAAADIGADEVVP